MALPTPDGALSENGTELLAGLSPDIEDGHWSTELSGHEPHQTVRDDTQPSATRDETKGQST